MTLQSVFILLPSIISGGVLAHLIWPDREFKSILFKMFLGIGVGLGINSLLSLVFLLVFNRLQGFFGLQILVMVVLISTLFFLNKQPFRSPPGTLNLPGRIQMIFLILAGIIVILALAVYVTVSLRQPQGAWDSWMIYNRAARFIYRGGDHWADAFSPELYWFFHADYPPMIALNVASGWGALRQETVRVPMLVGGAFLFGSAGLLFAGLNVYKTLGQAVLALMVLFSVSGFIEIGSKQVADVPLSFFILATGILVFLYSVKVQRGLLVLAGLSAGLAAWTKNEGIVFMLISLLGLGVAYRKELKQIFPWYMLGLAVPITILVYFKTVMAPPGDLFVGLASRVAQVTDLSRHFEILKQLGFDLRMLVNWTLLVVYALVIGIDNPRATLPAFLAFLIAILLQLVGYYSIFLVSPHPLLWHLSALSRLLLQIGPLIVFLYFSLVRPPETVFQQK
jgi:hypothetical protein